ncbi:calcineurin-like phosphoesterase C-terminal domain-containing protein [Mariniflexile sp.]|uniref:calcineurin-like phosphoesterase C-terminal domain-containing protein n=1 Tax=Mariniflexile sp. TaxID=1979402 RepID=UPI004048CC8F
MDQSRRKFIKIGGLTTIASLSGMGLLFSSCENDDDIKFDDLNKLGITGVSIPTVINVVKNGNILLDGNGFIVGDQIELISTTDPSIKFLSSITAVTQGTFTFTAPEGFSTSKFNISLIRGSDTLLLGATLFNLILNTNIPDIAGMTVKGLVYSDGKGIAGVVVSDGIEVTTTNEDGIYYLPSVKKTGFVFISIPGNYEVINTNNSPQFFKRLSKDVNLIEQKDFSLISINNNKHVVIPMADWHLANRNNDIDQFNNSVLPDVNATINKYAADGTKVYILTLGDMTWDAYWYDNNFTLSDYVPYMSKLNSPVFNLIGNHDYDPYYANDFEAENKYREVLGPTYYSFNLGDVHYIVLDDIEYLNTGGSIGTIGERNYNYNLSQEQLTWLNKDLAAITDKSTPIVVAMHSPLYRTPKLDASGNQTDQLYLTNGSAFVNSLKDFTKVHVLSGHLHVNYRVQQETNIMEHNLGAICATWWWTGRNGYAGNHICKDGSPGGYGIWKMDGKNLKWSYKSIGFDENYQFRSYDLNKVHITAANFAPNSTNAALAPYTENYATPNSGNQVLINVWGYEKEWKVVVTENGNNLNVIRTTAKDPLHIISYDALRVNVGATPTDAFVTDNTSHLFKVSASGPATTLEIKVTDSFGNIFTESMVRPKAFSYSTI